MNFNIPFMSLLEIMSKYWFIYLEQSLPYYAVNNYTKLFKLIDKYIRIRKRENIKNLVLTEKLLSIILLDEYYFRQSKAYVILMITKAPFAEGIFTGCITTNIIEQLKNDIQAQEKFIEHVKLKKNKPGIINVQERRLELLQAELSSKLKVRDAKIKMFQDGLINYRYACASWRLK